MRRLISDVCLLVLLPLWLLGIAHAQYNSFPPGVFTGRAALDASAGVAATTWDPAALGAGITLSGGNLTATYSGASSTNAGKANKSHSTGKFYFETNWIVGGGSNAREWGIGNSSAGTTGYQVGVSDANAIGYGTGGTIFFNGGTVPASVLNCAAGGGSNFCAIAVDLGGALIWFWSDNPSSLGWNNSATANPATGTGGLPLSVVSGPYFPMYSLFATADQVVANFGATTYNYATMAATLAAAGFGNW